MQCPSKKKDLDRGFSGRDLNLNLNSLLVTRQKDNPSPRIRIRMVYWRNAKMTIPHQGLGRGRLVPSSHKGSKFRYSIVRQFGRGDERIREDIPVPDSLGKEAFLVGIFTLAVGI